MKNINTIRDESGAAVASIADLMSGRAALIARIGDIRKQINETKNMHVPKLELEARCRAVVNDEAALWIHKHATELLDALGHSTVASPNISSFFAEPMTEFGAACALDAETATRFLVTLALKGAYRPGLPTDKRDLELRRLERELTETCQAEEDIVDAAVAAGLALTHRSEVAQRRRSEAAQQEQQAKWDAEAPQRAEHARRVASNGQVVGPPARTAQPSEYVSTQKAGPERQ